MTQSTSLMPYKTKIALAVALFLWASAFVGIRAGLEEYSPEGLALLRYLVASLCMGIVYFRLPKRSIMRWQDVCGLLAIGVIGIGVYNIMLNYGELSISSGMASFIISQSPIMTAIFALIFLGERLNAARIAGFTVSVCGVALIAMGEKGGFKWDSGVLYILIATITGGFFSVMQKPFLKRYHAIEATSYIIWGGTLFLLFYTPEMREDLAQASFEATLMVVYLGIFPAAIGYIAWAIVLAQIPASRAVSFLYFMPFLATALGWLYLGEVPMWLSVIGGILAIIGVWLVNQSYSSVKLLSFNAKQTAA
jgi:drug/metabolite transporter (DMT)-like permease